MDVICLQEEAFYSLVEKVLEKFAEKNSDKGDDWIDGKEVMRRLRIKSTTTLQSLRDGGKIRYSQLNKKHILYDVTSIDSYLERNAHDTF